MIDIHAHLAFDYATRSHDVDALLADMDRHGIEQRVVSALEGVSTAATNDFVSGLTQAHPGRLLGAAVLNPKEVGVLDEAARLRDLPGIVMAEFNSFEHGYFPDTVAQLPAVLDILDDAGIGVKVFTGVGAVGMPHMWVRHAQAHPDLDFVFLHCGAFDYGYGCVDIAAENPNISVETSNQYEVQILRKMAETLPAEKIVFGTSFPERFTSSGIGVFDGLGFNAPQLELVFGGNAARILNRRSTA